MTSPLYETLIVTLAPPFAHITLNRPHKRNAMNFAMMDEIAAVFAALHPRDDIRAVVLQGAEGNFCAGGDLADLAQAAQGMTREQEDRQISRLEAALLAANDAPQVVVARLEGAVMGGGFGLACISDIAIAADDAAFALPEVRIGLAPSLIAPYIVQRMGLTQARRLMLTGERFNGQQALAYGIVHEAVKSDALDSRIQAILDELRQCAPGAIRAVKALLHTVMAHPAAETLAYRASLINDLRYSAEGQEGMAAFLAKRAPKWTAV
ncbi:MAG: enoyl-CoA hydratase-related protein [bacterium]|nr:enoyl-CoA hydratase-related protein [bacterium]